MKRIIYVCLTLLFLGGCEKGIGKTDVSTGPIGQSIPERSTLQGRTSPEWNSFSCNLPLGSISLLEITYDFSVDISNFIKASRDKWAFMSTNRFSVEDRSSVVSRPLDESGVSGQEMPDPAVLPTGEVQHNWKAPFTITAGPMVCTNAVIISTAEPAIVLLNPETLQVIQTLPIQDLIIAFIAFNPETFELTALHGDLRVGKYVFLNMKTDLLDPVNEKIGPDEKALAAIQEKTAQLLSLPGPAKIDKTLVYPVDSQIYSQEPHLFRFTVAEDGPYRIYLDGIGEVPFLLALFNETGESILSNVEYAAEKVLETSLSKDAVYYLLVSLFPDNPANKILENKIPLLVIKQK